MRHRVAHRGKPLDPSIAQEVCRPIVGKNRNVDRVFEGGAKDRQLAKAPTGAVQFTLDGSKVREPTSSAVSSPSFRKRPQPGRPGRNHPRAELADNKVSDKFSALIRTFFAIPGPFFFGKEVKTIRSTGTENTWNQKGAITASDILSDGDETLGFAVQSGLKRTQSWRVPPNWSRGDWFEELTAVGTAAAWQALCDFDPDRGVPLAGFGYCRMMARCLSRYRKEWKYALHLVASDSREEETTTFNHPGLAASSASKADGANGSNNDLHSALGALVPEQRRLIEQLFWRHIRKPKWPTCWVPINPPLAAASRRFCTAFV